MTHNSSTTPSSLKRSHASISIIVPIKYYVRINIQKIGSIFLMVNFSVLTLLLTKQNYVPEKIKTSQKRIITNGKHALIIITTWIKDVQISKIIAMKYAQLKNVKIKTACFLIIKFNKFITRSDIKVNFVKHIIINLSNASIRSFVRSLTIKHK